MVPADDDPKVKDMLDAATRADLERWFGLPWQVQSCTAWRLAVLAFWTSRHSPDC